jgi:hypothetical protein
MSANTQKTNASKNASTNATGSNTSKGSFVNSVKSFVSKNTDKQTNSGNTSKNTIASKSTNTSTSTNTQNALKSINTSKPANTTVALPTSISRISTIGIVLAFVVLILIAFAAYWVYDFYDSKSFTKPVEVEAIKNVMDAKSTTNIGGGTIPSSKYSNEYSISIWMKIDDYTYRYGKEKVILRRGGAGSGNPEIVLAPNTNDLIVRVKMQTQNITNKVGNSSVSNFTDLQQLQGNMLQDTVSAYDQPDKVINKLDHWLLSDTVHDNIFDKISGNDVNYPTVKYIDPTNNQSDSMNKDQSMTVLNNKALAKVLNTSGKDKFNDTISYRYPPYSGNMNTCILVPPGTISPGCICAPQQQVQNQAIVSPELDISIPVSPVLDTADPVDVSTPSEISLYCPDNGRQLYSLASSKVKADTNVYDCPIIETFDDVQDVIDATVGICIVFCNLGKILMDSATAKNDYTSINKMFTDLIGSIETMKNGDSSIDVNASATSFIDDSQNKIKELKTSEMQSNLDKLKNYTDILSKLQETNVDVSTLVNSINTKMKSINCQIQITGSTDSQVSVSTYQEFIKLLKTTLYTYFYNLGKSIQENNPELGSYGTGDKSDPTTDFCVVKNIPLQKWVNIIVSVYNQTVDVYIDGDLVSSKILKSFPANTSSDISIVPDGGFSGQISKVTFSNSAATGESAKNMYIKGPIVKNSIFSSIPTWVYYLIAIIIIGVIIYSFFM